MFAFYFVGTDCKSALSGSKGRFSNASEVVRAGLRLLEEENRIILLRHAIYGGMESGRAGDFDPKSI
ncbi:type II toxin-antitoxin system ParD family antitoxin [Flavobacterium fontis]|uniref:type II toxin-antitoxin system ParD family antitoxin n=1 Tax=Flavobacterium fontis TaxID=1124188 RepID=UPI0009347BBA|nr:type II toxin-antitoxin system ParD family antitoxin [Flavobacterium fontis]